MEIGNRTLGMRCCREDRPAITLQDPQLGLCVTGVIQTWLQFRLDAEIGAKDRGPYIGTRS